MAPSSGDDRDRSCCFNEWLKTQHSDLSELLQALSSTSTTTHDDYLSQLVEKTALPSTSTTTHDDYLRQIVKKTIKHFQEYTENKARLTRDTNDVSPHFAPSSSTSLENSLLWIGGCRPTQFFRFLYGLGSSDIESKLADFLQGTTTVNLGGDLSGKQLELVSALHVKTIRKEEKMTRRLASLQEEPLTVLASRAAMMVTSGVGIGESDDVVEKVVDEHERRMGGVLEEADKLRVRTLKKLLTILRPMQGVHFLAAGMKLNFGIHEWGTKRDHQHGRFRNLESDRKG